MSHDLESVWAFRENSLYPRLFGSVSRGIFVLEHADFSAFGRDDCDPRWLHLGVFEFAPNETRESWLYVTSGGSTPWETEADSYEPEGYSWLGVEFVIESSVQGDWPVRLLRRLLAFHVLACHGHFGNRPGVMPGVCIPVGGPIDGAGSVLEYVVATEPSRFESRQSLPSGRFDILQFVGLSRDEAQFAREQGAAKLMSKLVMQGAAPVIDPRRSSAAL